MSRPFDDIAPWPPVRYTRPLNDDFASAFDGYVEMFQLVWRNSAGYDLEGWQITLIRSVLELYPEGHPRAGQLRYRQVVISLGRQNGKTEIAAALGLWALLVKATALVIGIASSVDQARLVYDRTMHAIRSTPQLARKFKALTTTRGIRSLSGGKYEMKAAKSGALQGIPIDLGLVDELHILAAALWNDLVNGTGGRPNCLVAGITTAGDDDSELLLHLYEQGDAAIAAGDASRMGFFLWEAPEARMPEDDETLGRYLAYANPAVAEGRVDLDNVIADVRSMPAPDAIRYRLNRFVASLNAFIPVEAWRDGFTAERMHDGLRPVFTFGMTQDMSYATIAATYKLPDETIFCDMVASIANPTWSQLADVAQRLTKHAPVTFGMGAPMKPLAAELEIRGIPCKVLTYGEFLSASALFYAKVTQGLLKHPGHPLMSVQIPRTVRKNVGEQFRISFEESSIEIDSVIAHVIGVHLAETSRQVPMQIF